MQLRIIALILGKIRNEVIVSTNVGNIMVLKIIKRLLTFGSKGVCYNSEIQLHG